MGERFVIKVPACFRDNPKLGDGNFIIVIAEKLESQHFRDNPKLGDGNRQYAIRQHPGTYHFRDNPKLGDGNLKRPICSQYKPTF